MVNVLLNYYNFDGDWTEDKLDFIRGKRPLVVPLAYRDSQAHDELGWQALYGKGGEKYDAIVRPFLHYGYSEGDIAWLNFYRPEVAAEQIASANLLFFTGGLPEKIVERLQVLGLTQAVKNFDGVVMGASAGAMFQLGRYHITPDYDYPNYGLWQGLGLVDGFDVEVHFENTPLQQACAKRAAKQLSVPVYAMYHEGGLVVKDGKVQKLGNVVEF